MKKESLRILKFALIFSIAAIFTGCSKFNLEKKNIAVVTQDGREILLNVEIADQEEERMQGYMFRKNIPDGTGMLFVFENDQILSFWMKNTPHPLSIAYITKDGKIRDIFDMTPYSLNSIVSTGYVRYALEVPQGWYKKAGISTGDYVKLK